MGNEVSAIGIIGGSEGTIKIKIDEKKVSEVENIFAKYAPILKPNRKPVSKILEYIKSKYPAVEDTSIRYKRMVEMNVLADFYKGKSANEIPLKVTVLHIRNEGTATVLYDLQKLEYVERVSKMKQLRKDYKNHSFKNIPIRICAEQINDYMVIEGSDALGDEIIILRGLDEIELKNKYLVANYVKTLKKYKMIE
ncbi:hypothetical protein [Oceanirhabdus seepicola]|uniref:Uncharacterized protein n=1 Tax=Oceanirhabdus seepicola TaxID=2828781 RepID=A0A9J6P6M3_9CLOT|nr:hypothetical protein [Oceanirhabdus seepicola]MCM1991152.1 hypothetical protein [Oceanirhabdus seepicola]